MVASNQQPLQSTSLHFPQTSLSRRKEERERGSGEALGRNNLVKLQQRPRKEKESVKKRLKGHSKAAKNGLWKCRWDLRPGVTIKHDLRSPVGLHLCLHHYYLNIWQFCFLSFRSRFFWNPECFTSNSSLIVKRKNSCIDIKSKRLTWGVWPRPLTPGRR